VTPSHRAALDARHSNCHADTPPNTYDAARYIATTHAGHGPRCLQALAAGAYLSAGNSDDE